MKRLSAYDDNFEQHLYEYGIYLNGRKSGPANKTDLHKWRRRASLTSTQFPQKAFERFQEEHENLGSEADVMRKLVPIISGNANIPNSGNVLMNNLISMTDETTVDPQPDFYDGARLEAVDKEVVDDLSGILKPSKNTHCPVLPNFFLEVKAPRGGTDVAMRQAGFDGAFGARALHGIQNYRKHVPTYDGNAYCYSSTYHAGNGTLQIYAHHVTAPTVEGGRPEYHMTKLRGFNMTDCRDTFVEGAAVFRNARDLARLHRDEAIRIGNARASQIRRSE